MACDANHTATRRAEILSAAERIFDAHGYAATTMDAVAGAAGISKGSLYNYFSNKQDLFKQVFVEAVSGDEQQIERLTVERLPATRKLERLLDVWSSRLNHYKRIGRLVLEFWATAAREGRDGEFAGWFSEQNARWQARIEGIVTQGIEAGEFRAELDPSIAAALIHAMIDGITIQVITGSDLRTDEEFFAGLKRAILIALTAAPAATGSEEQP